MPSTDAPTRSEPWRGRPSATGSAGLSESDESGRLDAADDRALFEAIFSNAAIGIALVDMQGHPVMSNPALERMLGYTADELRKMAFTEFTHPDDAQADWDLFSELVAGERDHYAIDKRYIHRDGQIVVGKLTVSLIRAPHGAPRYAVGMVEDVTERQRAAERFRTLVEQLPGIVYTADFGKRGRWRYASPFATSLLGFSADELLADPLLWWRQIHLDDRARVIEEERRSSAKARPFACEYRMFTKEGETRWVYDVATVVDDAGGHDPALQGLMLDVTERKLAEERLAESEAMLRTMIESEPECVKLVGADGELLAMNPAGLEMIEAGSAKDVIGRCIYPVVVPEDREAFRALTEAAFRGDSGTLGFDIVGLRGTRRSMESNAVPLRDQAGRVVACLSITRDVTSRKRAQAELEIALARTEKLAENLQRLNATKSDLIQILSHELFTPVTVIQGVAMTLAQDDMTLSTEDHRSLVSSVGLASQRLRRLVGNIAAAARLGREGIQIAPTRGQVSDLIARATAEFPSSANRIQAPPPSEIMVEVCVETDLAVRAIAIVLENALDLSEGRVEVEVVLAGGSIVVSVADHGPGVPDEAPASIFDAFLQGDSSSTRGHEGLGIGLYLARGIMQAHGGDIRLAPREGYGAVFELEFPVNGR